jgi:hypothetical protein
MKTNIFLYGQEFNDDWKGQNGTITRINSLTNKYLYAIEKLNIDGKVTISIDVNDGEKATEKDLNFSVQADKKDNEDEIWNTISRITNEKK